MAKLGAPSQESPRFPVALTAVGVCTFGLSLGCPLLGLLAQDPLSLARS